MNTNRMIRAGMAVAIAIPLLSGCTTPEGAVRQADIDTLWSEIAQLRADSKIMSDDAAASAAAAKAAAEKADKIYLQSLRK